MSSIAQCLVCGRDMSITPQHIGTEVTCPHCQATTLVMSAPVPPTAPPTPRTVPPQSSPNSQIGANPAKPTQPPKQLTARQIYVKRIRSESSYPALRGVLGFGLAISLLFGALFGLGLLFGLVSSISGVGKGFSGIGGFLVPYAALLFYFVACFATYQAGVVVIDIADVAIDQATGDGKNRKP